MSNQSFLQSIQAGEDITIDMPAEAAKKLIALLSGQSEFYWAYYAYNKMPNLVTEDGLKYDLLGQADCCGAWVDVGHLWEDAPDAVCPHCGGKLSLGREMDSIQFEGMVNKFNRKREEIIARMNE